MYMRIKEILTEAHHSIVKTLRIGPWQVQLDSHFLVSVAHKGIDIKTATSIVTYSALQPDIYQTVPVGKGVFYQDVNTMISIYVHRVNQNTIRVETVLPPSEIPKPPMFRRPVPPNETPRNPDVDRAVDYIRKQSQLKGRDAVSQEIEKIKPYIDLNRAQRRKLYKPIRKFGVKAGT
jgi:hypothetical protein